MCEEMDKKIADIKKLINMSESELEELLKHSGLSEEKQRLIASRLESIQTTVRQKAETCKVPANGGTDDGRDEK